jgi:hypothetical protein
VRDTTPLQNSGSGSGKKRQWRVAVAEWWCGRGGSRRSKARRVEWYKWQRVSGSIGRDMVRVA